MVGNGDVYVLAQLGTTYSLVESERDPASTCAAIAAGRVRVVSRPLAWSTAVRITASVTASSRSWPFQSPELARASMQYSGLLADSTPPRHPPEPRV